MNSRFQGLVALVTGGTSGIGLATVQLLALEGGRVVFCGRREHEGTEIERRLRVQNLDVRFVCCDVCQEAEVEALVAQSLAWEGRLDAAVNCAGISPRRARVTEATVEAYEAVFAVNVRGLFLSLKHEMRAMEANPAASIVNIASVLGIKAANLNHALYTASKHAVVGLTKAAALEGAASGTRVNVLCPGVIDTPIHSTNASSEKERQKLTALHPLNRLGTAEEVASACAYLLSRDASFITGAVLTVDGGASL